MSGCGDCSVFVMLSILCLCLNSVGGQAQQDDTTCYQATGNQTFSNSRAENKKVPILGKPERIHFLHQDLNYGYLGDQCVPGYNLTQSGHASHSSSTPGKWRVICKAPSHVFVIVLGLDVPTGDYLQVRRRALTGSVQHFQSLELEKNSILIGYISANRSEDIPESYPFRLAYICAGRSAGTASRQLLRSRAVLDYIEEQADGIDKLAGIMRDIPGAYVSKDPVVKQILSLADLQELL